MTRKEVELHLEKREQFLKNCLKRRDFGGVLDILVPALYLIISFPISLVIPQKIKAAIKLILFTLNYIDENGKLKN